MYYLLCTYRIWFGVFFPGKFFHSRVTGACPVTTDLIKRVNMRTAATPVNHFPPLVTTLLQVHRSQQAHSILPVSCLQQEQGSGVPEQCGRLI